MKPFKLKRKMKTGTYMLTDVVKGLEKSKTLWKIFGSRAKAQNAIQNTKLWVSPHPWIIWVSDKTGKVIISEKYLRTAPRRQLFLDFVHEMVHVKQFIDGRSLHDRRHKYEDRPIEIEAYKYTVEEAKSLGMNRRQIIDYLKVPWVMGDREKRMIQNILGR